MAHRNKTYVCFDGDNDMHWYRMMTAWDANKNFAFEFNNAHELNTARDSSQEESIKRQLRERFAHSRELIVLIGERTRYLRKFVQWEMEVAIKLNLPIIGVNLNGSRSQDDLCPPAIRDELAVYIPFGAKIIEYALGNWSASHARFKAEGKTGPFYYVNDVYESLGLN